LGQIEEGKDCFFFAKFSGIPETKIVEMESFNEEYLQIFERVNT
jgi:hypothetical protein